MGTFTAPFQGKIDVPLTNFAREFRNNALVSDRVAPRVPTMKQSDLYAIWGTENLQDPGDEVRATTAAAIEVVQTLSTDKFFTDDHALSRLVALEEPSAMSSFGRDPYRWATQVLMDRLLLKKEIRLATLITDAAQYAAANKVTLSGTSQWSDAANSSPIDDVETAKLQVGLIGTPANTMVLSPSVFAKLRVNDEIKARFANVTGGPITLQQLAEVFSLDNVLLSGAVKESGGTKSYVWGKDVWVGYVSPAPSPEDVSFCKSFVWESAPGTVQGFATEINDVYPKSRRAQSVDVHFYYDQKITSAESGYIIKAAIA